MRSKIMFIVNDFPKLMKLKESGIVVLFTSAKAGMVVYNEESSVIDKEGDFRNDWDPEYFEDFTGEIHLSN